MTTFPLCPQLLEKLHTNRSSSHFKFHARSGLWDMPIRQAARTSAFLFIQVILLNQVNPVDQIPNFPSFQITLGYRLMFACFQNMIKER